MYSGRYGHVLKPDGSYIEPKNFIDQFSIHMHKNRALAFEGMTLEEMQQAEECVQHFRETHMGKKASVRQNAFASSTKNAHLSANLDAEEVPENDQGAWFDDVHSYSPI